MSLCRRSEGSAWEKRAKQRGREGGREPEWQQYWSWLKCVDTEPHLIHIEMHSTTNTGDTDYTSVRTWEQSGPGFVMKNATTGGTRGWLGVPLHYILVPRKWCRVLRVGQGRGAAGSSVGNKVSDNGGQSSVHLRPPGFLCYYKMMVSV